MNLEELKKTGEECGFTHVGGLDVSTIRLMPEVREMCAKNTCGMYGRNWCCPPGSGSLEECEKKIRQYTKGILVQTVGELEDALDGEAMMETEQQHKEHFYSMQKILEEKYPGMLAIGSGTCTRCKKCTYPDAPAVSRTTALPPWNPMACWLPTSARPTIFRITMDPARSPTPAVSCWNKIHACRSFRTPDPLKTHAVPAGETVNGNRILTADKDLPEFACVCFG